MKHRRCAIYRVAVGLLVGQGWERERPTLPKLYGEENKAVGLGLFPFNALLLYKKTSIALLFHDYLLPLPSYFII